MAGEGAGQHTTQASKTVPIAGAMSSGGPVTWNHNPGTPRAADHTDMDPENCNAIGLGAAVGPYRVRGSGRTNFDNPESTLGMPAAAATETAPQSTGCTRPTRNWP